MAPLLVANNHTGKACHAGTFYNNAAENDKTSVGEQYRQKRFCNRTTDWLNPSFPSSNYNDIVTFVFSVIEMNTLLLSGDAPISLCRIMKDDCKGSTMAYSAWRSESSLCCLPTVTQFSDRHSVKTRFVRQTDRSLVTAPLLFFT